MKQLQLAGVNLGQVAKTAGPAVAGGVACGIAGYALSQIVARVPMPAAVRGFITANKEVISLLLVLVGVWGRVLVKSTQFWLGWLVVAVMALADNLMVRFGVDLG